MNTAQPAAPRERVWQAITDPAELERWFLPPYLGARLTRDAGGTISMKLGDMKADIATLQSLKPPRQATTYGLPDRLIAIIYTLEEERDGTRVTINLSGGESLSGDAAHERLAPSGAA